MTRKLNRAKREPGSLLSRQRTKLIAQKSAKIQAEKQKNIDKYETEKAARKTNYGYSGHLMSGSPSSSSFNRLSLREFLEIAEGKKSNIPPNAVPGTYKENPDGSRSYKLKPPTPLKKPLTKKQIFKELERQGGIGGSAIEKELKRREKNK